MSEVLRLVETLEHRTSLTSIERILELPLGETSARWKKGEATPEELALLRVLVAFPWILDMAEDGFQVDKMKLFLAAIRHAQIAILEEAADQMSLPALGSSEAVMRARDVLYELRDSIL